MHMLRIFLLFALCSMFYSHGLTLERTVNLDHPDQIKNRVAVDRRRHGRRLFNDTAELELEGNVEEIGMYTTKVKVGTPAKELIVQVDTGSDLFWVSCTSLCRYCTRSPNNEEMYDPAASSTVEIPKCSGGTCDFNMTYVDGTGSGGYYVRDMLIINIHQNGSSMSNYTSVRYLFGCSTEQKGDLAKGYRPIHGLIGFGPGETSAISQLSAMNLTLKIFSHCLKGPGKDGGILDIGEVLVPGIEFTPLLPSRPHYNVDFQGIRVNDTYLEIDPLILSDTSFDSGTTFSFIPVEAHEKFVSAVTASVPNFVNASVSCYLIPVASNGSISMIFPTIYLDFAENATMVLKPEHYLLYFGFKESAGAAKWCLGFLPSATTTTILGDLVLRNKIVVYDLHRQRIGWIAYDCSLPYKVSSEYSSSTKKLDQRSKIMPAFCALFLTMQFIM